MKIKTITRVGQDNITQTENMVGRPWFPPNYIMCRQTHSVFIDAYNAPCVSLNV